MRKHGIVVAYAFLAACGGPVKGPETPRIVDNAEATHRIDILPQGHGSGVVIDADRGLILTCHHVAGEGERDLIINIAVGDKAAVAYPARVVAWDEDLDLAVIKVERRFEREVVLASDDEIHVLDDIYNVGFPYDLGEMAGKGHIKAVHHDDPEMKLKNALVVDISDGPGTSGSGVFLTRNGKLIGIMKMLIRVGPMDGRQVIVRVLTGVDDIRAFLDRAKISYRTAYTDTAWAGDLSAVSGSPEAEPVTIVIDPPEKGRTPSP